MWRKRRWLWCWKCEWSKRNGNVFQSAFRKSTHSERERWVGQIIFITVYSGQRANRHTPQSLNHPQVKTQRVFSDPSQNPPERRESITNKVNQVPRLHIRPCTDWLQTPLLCKAVQQTVSQFSSHLHSQCSLCLWWSDCFLAFTDTTIAINFLFAKIRGI